MYILVWLFITYIKMILQEVVMILHIRQMSRLIGRIPVVGVIKGAINRRFIDGHSSCDLLGA